MASPLRVGVLGFPVNHGLHAIPQGHWGHKESTEALLLPIACKVIKQLHQVLTNHWTTGEQAKICIKTRCFCVVISSANMSIAAYTLPFLAHDQGHFCVGLITQDPIDHMNTGSFQLACPLNVIIFIKARLQLHQRQHLFAMLRSPLQSIHNR